MRRYVPLSGWALSFALVAACASPTPSAPLPSVPPASTPPGVEAKVPERNTIWSRLGRFYQGEWWYEIWEGAVKRGYGYVSVSEEDGSLVVVYRMRQLQYDPDATVIEDGWYSYDKNMQLTGYVYNGQDRDAWFTGRVVGTDLKVRGGGGTDGAVGTSEAALTIDDPQPIPVHLLGQVARFLPQETGLRFSAMSFSPTLSETVPGGYFLIGEKAFAGFQPRPLAGRLIFYVGADGYVSRTYLIDELGKMLIQCKDAGLTLTSRWILASSPAAALAGLPPEIEVAEQDRPYLPARTAGKPK